VILPSLQSLNENTWQNLLVGESGWQSADHWSRFARRALANSRPSAGFRIKRLSEPQSYRGAEVHLPGKVVPLSFDQQKQFALEGLRFSDG
jgi:hypothetical protein